MSWLQLQKTTKDLNLQNYYKHLHLQCSTIKYFAMLQPKKKKKSNKKQHIEMGAGFLKTTVEPLNFTINIKVPGVTKLSALQGRHVSKDK